MQQLGFGALTAAKARDREQIRGQKWVKTKWELIHEKNGNFYYTTNEITNVQVTSWAGKIAHAQLV